MPKLKTLLLSLLLLVAWTLQLSADEKGLRTRSAFTYGLTGSIRSNEFLLGDKVFIATEIDGLKTQADHVVDFAMKVDVMHVDQTDRLSFESQSGELTLPLGGSTARQHFFIKLPLTAEPGDYRVRVVVDDHLSQRQSVETLVIKVHDISTFGATNIRFTRDKDGVDDAGGVFKVGETAYLHLGVVGFISKEKRPNVTLTATTFQDKDELTSQLFHATRSDVSSIPLVFHQYLNRPGRFRTVLELKDNHCGASVKHVVEFVVIDSIFSEKN